MSSRTVVGRITRECESCGKSVTRKASAFKAHTFCTRACYLASDYHAASTSAANLERFPARVRAHCLHCGVAVERPPSQMSKKTYCSVGCKWAAAKTARCRQITPQGYIKVFVGKDFPEASRAGHIYEHRLVMQEHLGRGLLRHETVHHINGLRSDNRLENLELWSSSHPSGQRVVDKVAWAREMLATYEDLPIE